MLRIMACHLELAKLSFAVIEGGVTARKRMTLVDEFNRNPIKPKVTMESLKLPLLRTCEQRIKLWI